MTDSLGPAPTSAAAAANRFLELAWADGAGAPPVTQMKLQKLLFYAHAWHLALKNAPLFDEDFEAWPWGPVVRDVYIQTLKFGRDPVTEKIKRLVFTPGNHLSGRFKAPEVDDSETSSFIQSVWDSHRRFTGIQLSNATHAQGEPWTIIKDAFGGSLDKKPTIPNDLIREVYRRKISDGSNRNSAASHNAG